ncbi:MAG: rhamnulokinase [Lentisphaeria bacterium]|nr:rhamnulokinase [Lentisphaeria bacterium]
MKKHFLAFDLGASSGRGIIGTLEDGKLALQEIHRFENGLKNINGSFFWDFPSLVEEIKKGIGKAFEVTRDISAIAIDTWGVDYVLFDRDTKEVKALPYHYRDERTLKYLDEIWSKISKDEIYKRTGIQFMPFNTLYQLYAHMKEKPEDLENAVFLHIPDALAYMIGGDFTTEYTDASTGNLLNPYTHEWDWEIIDTLGLPRDIFPKIVEPATLGGTLSTELQQKYGVGAIPIVKVGTHDTASAVLAVPAADGDDFAYISCGTWALLGAELNAPSLDVSAQTFTNEGGVGQTIRYLTNIMGCWLLQETRRDFIAKGRKISFSEMGELSKAAEPLKYLINPNDSFFTAPENMISRVKEFAAMHGQNGSAMSDGEVIRAIHDSLGLCFRVKLTELGKILGKNYKVLNIIGGGTQDDILMQSAADAGNITVVAGPIEATAIGNILAQAMACKVVANISEARKIVRDSFDVVTYTPSQANRNKYDEAFEKFIKF